MLDLIAYSVASTATSALRHGFDQTDALILNALVPIDRHPLWVWDWNDAFTLQVFVCSIVLFFSGLLCSAGGIGGGGLSAHDAVPLSKAIVFSGTLSSLALNMGKYAKGPGNRSLIDYGICCVVVPSALVGTLLGVLLNRNVADYVILVILSILLFGMTVMVCGETWKQHKEEEELQDKPESVTEEVAFIEEAQQLIPATGADLTLRDIETTPLISQQGGKLPSPRWGILMLLIVIVCGVARFHAGACWADLRDGSATVSPNSDACHHPL
eukprot:CAMPEP_0170641598 /NCGR_PEP_ID=MMETSP0224-20130122/40866_1 /TAXON_ID=285029 /ORGANISM="Togula jolla, Strain CCCM 725" /LENGTH=269 /DNA_ID=CAMNT_0010972227 /DNA_START=63 /DNA_END=869 /DNA_ORIENTATION=+